MSFCALRFSRFSRPISNYSRSMPIFFGTARFYRSAASTMKYRRRNISMHISYCVCFGGNRKPRGRSKNYLTSKLSCACHGRGPHHGYFEIRPTRKSYVLQFKWNVKNSFLIKSFSLNCTKNFGIAQQYKKILTKFILYTKHIQPYFMMQEKKRYAHAWADR